MKSQDSSISTISLFHYKGVSNCWFGFRQMGLATAEIEKARGVRFVKMLGTGGGEGFSVWPDFGRYGLLITWENESCAADFFTSNPTYLSFLEKSDSFFTIYLNAFQAHGFWDAQSPFISNHAYQKGSPVAIITRATIYTKHLAYFWRHVPKVSRSILGKEGLLYAVGVGELPIVQQATFSIWENMEAMKAYAYQSEHHRDVVLKTRERGWYKEELFARFSPYRLEGNWTRLPELKQSLGLAAIEVA